MSRWRAGRGRGALFAFGAVEVAALPLLLVFGRTAWFTQDDWDFLSARTIGNLGDWFRPHFQHLTTLPILAYRLLWTVFGLHTYVPYLALVVLAHLATAAMLRALMRRAGVRPWLATLIAGAFVFFGAGGENILVAFQVTFVGAFAFGLAQLLLADHDGPLDRRDWLGLLAGFTALLCSGVALATTIVVALTVLLRRGRRGVGAALFHTVPIGFAYLVWTVVAPEGQVTANLRSHSPVQVTKFVLVGIEAAFGGLGRLPGAGIALGAMLVAGLAVVFHAQGRTALRGARAASIALLVGAVFFLFVTGLARAGQGGLLGLLKHSGPERARESRYIYLVGAMCLPAIALAADALTRRGRLLAIPVVAVLLAGIPSNVHEIATYSPRYATPRATRDAILRFPNLPLAGQLRHSRAPYPEVRLSVEGLTLGWLVDSAGRIPDPGSGNPIGVATQTLHFMMQEAPPSLTDSCVPIRRRVNRVLDRRESITVRGGPVAMTYVPVGGARSFPLPFQPSTYTALAGPLRLRIAPLAKGVKVCH